MPREDLTDWLAFHLLDLTPRQQAVALERHGSPRAVAYRVPPAALAALSTRAGETLGDRIRRVRPGLDRRVERELEACRRAGIRVVTRDDPAYPGLLLEIPDPPPVLYVRGTLTSATTRVAIVGSRRSSAYGRTIAVEFASALAARGIQVVSGGARGIDAHAHRAAVDQTGGTLAVLGSGLARPYPPEHGRLFDAIADRGAVVTEFALEDEPLPFRFPRRNRLIAGLSSAVVVIEAANRSGSLVTARLAADQGREVLAVPGPVTSERSTGCHALLRAGATLARDAEDVIGELPPPFRPERAVTRGETDPGGGASDDPTATPDERAVLAALDPVEPLHVDDLADRVPFGIARLQAALFGLELRGAVDPLPGRYYCCPPRKER
jgi:DNA processing protein